MVPNGGFNLLLEGKIDQRKRDYATNDHDGGGQQDKERGVAQERAQGEGKGEALGLF
jgi:hypothetical protein